MVGNNTDPNSLKAHTGESNDNKLYQSKRLHLNVFLIGDTRLNNNSYKILLHMCTCGIKRHICSVLKVLVKAHHH